MIDGFVLSRRYLHRHRNTGCLRHRSLADDSCCYSTVFSRWIFFERFKKIANLFVVCSYISPFARQHLSNPFMHPPVCPGIYPSICLSIYLTNDPSAHQSILSFHPPLHLSIHISIRSPIHPPIPVSSRPFLPIPAHPIYYPVVYF